MCLALVVCLQGSERDKMKITIINLRPAGSKHDAVQCDACERREAKAVRLEPPGKPPQQYCMECLGAFLKIARGPQPNAMAITNFQRRGRRHGLGRW